MNDHVFALILGVVEGLTEFLPVSSTAHLRLAQALLGIDAHDNFWKLFAVVIQLPAVIAVVFYFFPQIVRFIKSFFAEIARPFRQPLTADERLIKIALVCVTHPVALVMIAFVMTAGPAVLAKNLIQGNLESYRVIGAALLIGGVVMWVVDTIYGKRERRLLSDAQSAAAIGMPQVNPAHPEDAPAAATASSVIDYEKVTSPEIVTHLEQMKPWQAAWIGIVQVLSAIFPGTSRSMCTIAAGQVANLTRAAALEFSFFLSIPIMFAATLKDLHDATKPDDEAYLGHRLSGHELALLGIGSVVSFVVAFMVIAWFMAWVRRRGFVPFAVYRIILGIVVLIAASRGMFGG